MTGSKGKTIEIWTCFNGMCEIYIHKHTGMDSEANPGDRVLCHVNLVVACEMFSDKRQIKSMGLLNREDILNATKTWAFATKCFTCRWISQYSSFIVRSRHCASNSFQILASTFVDLKFFSFHLLVIF
jgi:hypothetical protein